MPWFNILKYWASEVWCISMQWCHSPHLFTAQRFSTDTSAQSAFTPWAIHKQKHFLSSQQCMLCQKCNGTPHSNLTGCVCLYFSLHCMIRNTTPFYMLFQAEILILIYSFEIFNLKHPRSMKITFCLNFEMLHVLGLVVVAVLQRWRTQVFAILRVSHQVALSISLSLHLLSSLYLHLTLHLSLFIYFPFSFFHPPSLSLALFLSLTLSHRETPVEYSHQHYFFFSSLEEANPNKHVVSCAVALPFPQWKTA